MTIDTRVGFMAVSVLKVICEDYIKAYTINGKYTGRLDVLNNYNNILKYLGEKQ